MWVYLKSNFKVKNVYYNDVNPFMSNLFMCCSKYKEFLPYVKSIQSQNRDIFNEYRSDIVELFSDGKIDMPDFDVAKKYVYVATQVFSGIIKQNSKMVDLKGKYGSKYDAFMKRLNNPDIQEKLSKIVVSNSSYDEFIPNVDSSNTLLYIDPPYYSTENLYDFHGFTKDHHKHLLNMLKSIDSKWILSYYEFDILKNMLSESVYQWERKDYKKASMASKGKKQSVGTEVLVMN